MKIQHLFFGFLLLTHFACKQAPSVQSGLDAPKENPIVAAAPVIGMFVGAFDADVYDENKDISYSNKINLVIESLENGVAKGYSIVAGSTRPFTGTYTEKGAVVTASVKEPGDDKYDGAFDFVYRRDSQTVVGSWKANDAKLAVSVRKFDLAKREFAYNPDLNIAGSEEEASYITLYRTAKESEKNPDMAEFITKDAFKHNASKTLLTKEVVENMHKGDLEVIRNAIYARHGYSFKNRRWRYFFDNLEWYMPISTDVTATLTEIELKNIDLLKRYEEHAARYYDEFGR